MKKNPLFLLNILLLSASCNTFTEKVPNEQELLRKELHTIDWKKVDTYPSYDSCDAVKDMEKAKYCFFDTFQKDLTAVLQNDSLLHTRKYRYMDSLSVEVTVLPNAALELFADKKESKTDKSELDSLLFTKTTLLKPLHPATKRGIPVKTQFKIKVALR